MGNVIWDAEELTWEVDKLGDRRPSSPGNIVKYYVSTPSLLRSEMQQTEHIRLGFSEVANISCMLL